MALKILGSEVKVACDLRWLDLEERLVLAAVGFEINLGLKVALTGFLREAASWLNILRRLDKTNSASYPGEL